MEKSKAETANAEPGPAPRTAPDGGYGWVIVVAATLQFGVIIQIMPFFDLLFGPKLEEFGASSTEKGAVVAVFMVFYRVISPLVPPLAMVTSQRTVAILGSLLQSLGLIIAAVSSSKLHLILGIGVLCGNGLAISSTNNIIIINQYFKEKVGQAMAIGMAAIGVEGLILPQVIKILVTDLELSTQNVILVYAAICAVTTVTGAALMRPLPQFAPVNQDDETKAAAEDEKEKVNPVKKILSLIEWSLLKQPYFLFILTINGIFMTSLLLSITELGFVTQAREFTISEKANLFTIMNASDIVMKLAQGMIADLQFIKRTFKYPMKFLYRFNAVGMAITMLGAGTVDSFAELATVAAIATFFNANVMMNFSQILRWPYIMDNDISIFHNIFRELFPESFSSAVGLQSLAMVMISFIFPTVAGFLKQHFGDFRAGLLFLSGSVFTAVISWLLVDLMRKMKKVASS